MQEQLYFLSGSSGLDDMEDIIQMKADWLHFDLVVSVSCHVHSAGRPNQNNALLYGARCICWAL